MADKLTTDSVSAILARLKSLYQEAVKKVRSADYAFGSGEPDSSVGALRISYEASVPALERMANTILAGGDYIRDKSDENGNVVAISYSESFLKQATETEESFRKISGYSEGASIPSYARFASKAIQTAGQISDEGLPAIPSLFPKLTITLVVIVLGVIGLFFMYVSRSFSAVKAAVT